MAWRFPPLSSNGRGGDSLNSSMGSSSIISSSSWKKKSSKGFSATALTLLGNLATLSLVMAGNASAASSSSSSSSSSALSSNNSSSSSLASSLASSPLSSSASASSWSNFDDVTDGYNFTSVTTVVASVGNVTEAAAHTLPHPLWLTIIIGLLAGLLVVLTVLGNITVLLAFGLERTIRQPTNYFLASLAVSDLLIGTFSMPLYTQYLLFGVWPLGPWLCDLWLSLDWTVCLTSQYTVFLITMDRYLSVKIPAKYRNWRTEKKVLIMISVTWILPTLVFFTSIIGWQFFVGERTVKEGYCEVQFMSDAMFTFVLTIGYYWITLLVIGVLYGGIYKVALDLQRKSDAKHKKLQSTMELAGDGPNSRGNNNALGNNAEGASNNNSSGGDSNVPHNHHHHQNKSHGKSSSKAHNRKSVRAALPCPVGIPAVNTTSFSTNKGGGGADKDDDRSSSPAFASDDENSSSGGAVGAPKSPLSSGVYIGRPNPAAGIVNSALFANTGGLVRSLHGDLFFGGGGGGGGMADRQEAQSLLPSPPPPYSEVAHVPAPVSKQSTNNSIGGVGLVVAATTGTTTGVVGVNSIGGIGTENGGKMSAAKAKSPTLAQPENHSDDATTDDNLYYSSASEKQTTPLLKREEINKGSRYIDEQSFLANLNNTAESAALLLPDISKDASEAEDSLNGGGGGSDVIDDGSRNTSSSAGGGAASSPIWKRRHSLPLESCDGYDELDEEVSEFIAGDPTTTMTTIADLRDEFLHGDISNNRKVDVDGYNGDDDNIDNNVNGASMSANNNGYGDRGLQQFTDRVPPSSNNSSKPNAVTFDSDRNKTFGSMGNNVNNINNNTNLSSSNSGDQQRSSTTNTTTPPTTTATANSTSSPSAAAAAATAEASATATPMCNNNNNNMTPTAPPSDGNEESSRSDTHCLSAAHRRRNNNDTRLHTFVKSVRSRNSRRRNRRERKSKSENRARKALRTITIILGAFVLCWTPFHICVMIMALCGPCMNVNLYSFSYWMCYMNSPLNPFCYAFANAQFKRTFLRIMRFDWHRT